MGSATLEYYGGGLGYLHPSYYFVKCFVKT